MKLGGSAPRQLAPLSFPPPYQRMVAINSDVEFTTWTTQIDLLRCFTERRLETSFSYWFFGHSDITWHLFHPDMTLTEDGSAALPLLHEGVFDTVHSFTGVRNGPGYYLDRDMIHRGYKQLAGLGIVPRVYSNHGTEDDIQNIGGTWTGEPGMPWYMKGDLPGSRCYHLDLSLRHGIRFFWLDVDAVSYTHLRAHETGRNLVCRLLLEKKKKKKKDQKYNIKAHKAKKKNRYTTRLE